LRGLVHRIGTPELDLIDSTRKGGRSGKQLPSDRIERNDDRGEPWQVTGQQSQSR
jgi:hypothetical protein